MTLFWPPLMQNPAQKAAISNTHGGAETARLKSATNTTPQNRRSQVIGTDRACPSPGR